MNSKRKCGGCGVYFRPEQVFPGPVAWCSPDCGLAVASKRQISLKRSQKAVERKQTKKARESIKTKAEWLREAQIAVNAYIRARDSELPCVSCRRHHNGQYHAGHYRSTGSSPELRFDERNVHKQCAPCNNHLSGNLIPYRVELIRRIGQDGVDYLEGPHTPKKYTIEQIRQIRDDYRLKLKLKQCNQPAQ